MHGQYGLWQLFVLVCSHVNITLSPRGSSSFAPLQFVRSDDVYISSSIAWDCTAPTTVLTLWKVEQCVSNCLTTIEWNVTFNTISSEFFVPAFTLPVGLYQLTLTIRTASSMLPSASASAFVQITAVDVVASLMYFSTSLISTAHDVDLILDPGRFSIDPEQSTFNASVSDE